MSTCWRLAGSIFHTAVGGVCGCYSTVFNGGHAPTAAAKAEHLDGGVGYFYKIFSGGTKITNKMPDDSGVPLLHFVRYKVTNSTKRNV